MASTFEELQEKLAKAVEENTKAQSLATEMTGRTGKEIRRLAKDTSQMRKNAAFMEKDLGAELGESLSAPFRTLASAIPKPLRILAQMPVQAAMRGLTPEAAAPRTDPSGTEMGPGPSAFHGAISEAWGREISQEGILKGTAEHVKGMMGFAAPSKSVDALTTLVLLGEDHTKLLEDIAEKLEPPREASLGKGSGFREAGIESKILDPKTGKPFVVAGGGGGKGKPPTGGDGDGLIPDWMKSVGAGVVGGGAVVGGWALFRKGLLKFLGRGSLVGGAVVTSAMVLKDVYDLLTSAEERHQKGAENVGSMVGAGIGAGIGSIFGVPGAVVGMMLGNVIGEMIGKTIDAEKNPHIQAQLQALDMSLDELEDAREQVLKSEISNAQKQRELAKIEEQTLKLKEEEAAAEKRRVEIEKKKHKIATETSVLESLQQTRDSHKAMELALSQAEAAYEAGQGSLGEVNSLKNMLMKATNDMPENQQKLVDAQKLKVEGLKVELETLREEAKDKAGDSAVAGDIEKILAKARKGAGKFAVQRAAGGVAGLHDVPAGKSYQRHAQELMGEVYTEYDPSQTPQEKAYREIFGETMAGGTARWWDTAGPTGQSGMGLEGSMQGAKQFPVYISEAYKKMAAASGGQEQVDDQVMAMQQIFSTGRLAGSGITTDAQGKKMFKYSELVAMKERSGGYDDKFLSHRGEKIVDPEKRRALGLSHLEEAQIAGPIAGMRAGQQDMGSDYWTQAMMDDDAMMAMGGPRLGKLHAGGRYLSSAAYSGGLGKLMDDQLEFYGMTTSGGDYNRLAGETRHGSVPGDTFKSDAGTAFVSTGKGSGKSTAIFSRMLDTQEEVVEGVGKDKTSITTTSQTLSSVLFQTFKDGFFEIAAGVGDETKMVAGQIKTQDDITNVIENLASLSGEALDSEALIGLKEQLQKSLKTGHFGMEDLTKTGRIEQVGPHGDAWKVTKKGEEMYAKSFAQGGRQLGVPGAAMGGTEESKRARMLAGMSPDAGETPRDLMLAELAWGANTEVRTERTGPQRGGRGSETAPTLGIGGTKPYMTMNGVTTYALPPSSGVQGTPLADPYEGRARDAGGRLIHEPQYRPMGTDDMKNYPDYYWKQFGEAGHDPKTDHAGYQKAMDEYTGPTETPVALDEMTQEQIAEADKTTAEVLTDVKIGTKSSLGVTLVDTSGKVLELGQSLLGKSAAMHQSRMGGGEFTAAASAEERLYGGLGGMMTKIGTGKVGEITDKELLATEIAAKDFKSEMLRKSSSLTSERKTAILSTQAAQQGGAGGGGGGNVTIVSPTTSNTTSTSTQLTSNPLAPTNLRVPAGVTY